MEEAFRLMRKLRGSLNFLHAGLNNSFYLRILCLSLCEKCGSRMYRTHLTEKLLRKKWRTKQPEQECQTKTQNFPLIIHVKAFKIQKKWVLKRTMFTIGNQHLQNIVCTPQSHLTPDVSRCFMCKKLQATLAPASITHMNLCLNCPWPSWIWDNVGIEFWQRRKKK